MRIAYTASAYPAHYGPMLAAGTHPLDVTWAELAWASLTVGRQGWRDVIRRGRYSDYEAVFREALIYANLRENRRGLLSRSDAYRDLDPSEKSAVSYFLGLTMAKLLCDRLFKVPWLMHLDRYKSILNPRLIPGRRRPDLVGLNFRRDWIVVEAKGRSNRMGPTVLGKAKSQTKKLRMVAGAYPFLRCAMVTNFKGNTLHVDTADPEGYDEDAVDLGLTADGFLRDYYSAVADLLKLDLPAVKRGVFPDGYKGCALEGGDLFIGIHHEALNALDKQNIAEEFSKIAPTLIKAKNDTANKIKDGLPMFVGGDGVIVSLGSSWGKKEMHLQPEKRGH